MNDAIVKPICHPTTEELASRYPSFGTVTNWMVLVLDGESIKSVNFLFGSILGMLHTMEAQYEVGLGTEQAKDTSPCALLQELKESNGNVVTFAVVDIDCNMQVI